MSKGDRSHNNIIGRINALEKRVEDIRHFLSRRIETLEQKDIVRNLKIEPEKPKEEVKESELKELFGKFGMPYCEKELARQEAIKLAIEKVKECIPDSALYYEKIIKALKNM